MAKKNKITETDIITYYIEHVLEHHEKPKSVYSFSKKNSFEESEFYNFYGSFEALEKSIFTAFYHNTIHALENNEDYKTFDARNKLLSFYFTFFENLTANRSYVSYALKSHKNSLKALSVLSGLKQNFSKYIANLDIETLDIKEARIEKIQAKALQESAWFQLLVTLKFWLEDTSAAFEKTDIFIEKSVNTSFDILNIAPLKSVLDFGKFLFKEKMHMN
ncbi:MAG: TetR/AcrR family transcriptional regulator [Flavobacteriales bacterium]|nr:TetR/AcrR family transcriptional regulator [Flavobacteriia bacterium]NCP05236.1 TetR/AcrR family transcriptional regulator [Flavobacteriales bacterium]PIV92465.1 MAG: heat-shock protein [Flavobacteriaceae bacterium CG17_big_fil_post_rev_8_21_14_2_50_33_15]PIY10616.1 MAG: heat-shock protein [Flavobacteriaceae bacterium CG_4_10_14_3_um_filter_33_47]PJB19837.1 MAG: heat-shock protein [Flavobacteriaceae bacterium CG_4_9_14_3_um_filter_33_16]